jgi:rare lipoprotein A
MASARRATRSSWGLRQLVAAALVLAAACTPLPPEPSPPAPAPEPAAPPAAPSVPPSAQPQPPAPKPAPPTRSTTQTGKASFYAMSFAGKKTASGEIFDPEAMTMAHRTLPLGTRVRVTNLRNHQAVEVMVNDRGPAVEGRIADLSPAAARAIGLTDGLAEVRLEVLSLPD